MRAVRLGIIAAGLMTQFLGTAWSGVAQADQPKAISTRINPVALIEGINPIGKTVKNREGEDLGKMIINGRGGGDIEYAVLSSENALGSKYFTVPWSVLTLSGDKTYFVLNAKQAWGRNRHGLSKQSWLDGLQSDWAVVLYNVYEVHSKSAHKSWHSHRSEHTSPVVTRETHSATARPPS